MKTFKFFITLLLFTGMVYAAKTVPFTDLKKPGNIVIDQNQILVTEFPNIYIYSLEDFKLTKKFGKAGEGPREFFSYVRIQLNPEYPDYIIVGSHMKISYYTRDGKFVKEVRSKTSSVARVYKPLGKNYAAYGYFFDKKIRYNTVNLFDPDLNKIKEVTRWKRVIQENRNFNPTDPDLMGGEFHVYNKKIFVLRREKGKIDMFDDSGNKGFSINYDYERIPITDEDKQKVHHFYKTDYRFREVYETVKKQFEFPRYFPAARTLVIANDKIHVLTNKRENGKREFVIFDITGKYLKKSMIPFKIANIREEYPFTINNGKLYQLIDNIEKEEWELHIHPVE